MSQVQGLRVQEIQAAAESRGRTSCRGGTTPAKQSQEIPVPPNWSSKWGAGGVGVRQEQDTDPQGAASSKLSPQHTSKLEVIS